MLEINLLFGPKLHLMWREVDIYLTFLNSADALQLLKLSTILKHKIQFNQGPTERWEIFLVFFPNPGIVFYVVIDEGRLAKLRCVAECDSPNPAATAAIPRKLFVNPNNWIQNISGRLQQTPGRIKIKQQRYCARSSSSRNLLLLYKYYHISLSTIRSWLAPLRKILCKRRSGFD